MKPMFAFDGDCAFCSSSARFLARLTKHRIEIQPYQFLDLDAFGFSRAEAEQAVQYTNGVNRYQGARAIAECLIDSKTGWVALGWFIKAPVILSFAELVYLVVAKNRHRLPGGTPACKMPS